MNKLIIFTVLISLLFSPSPVISQPSTEAVVHAVLFYSPNCGHCHYVINEVLPPLFEKYGEQLVIVGVDASQPAGQELFREVLAYFEVDRGVVPFLVVGDNYLIGSADIPDKFPGLIDAYLAQGGVGWPDIPGLAEAFEAAAPTEAEPASTKLASTETIPPVSTSTKAPEPTPTAGLIMTGEQSDNSGAKFSRDPVGNSLSVLVLIAMVVSIVWGTFIFFRKAPKGFKGNDKRKLSWHWLFPVLCLIGLGVAGYLGFVETAEVEAVCGPVGDCNAVQNSEYATLFGIIHIGVLGVAGYLMIFMVWILGKFTDQRLNAFAAMAILGMTTFGILFSTYLTFLEPFVIGATCAWCLTSAIMMTALFWLSLIPGRLGLSNLMK